MVNEDVKFAGGDGRNQPGERSLSALFDDNKKFQLFSDSAANSLFRFFNYFGLIVPMLIVLAAMAEQVIMDELPCSHCNMMRLGFFMLALGPALNLRFGSRPSHYGLSLAGAFFLGAVALDMMVRVKDNGLDGYGPNVLGLYLYSWALIVALIGGVALILMFLWERPPGCCSRYWERSVARYSNTKVKLDLVWMMSCRVTMLL